MQLLAAHQILIAAAIALAGLFGVRSLVFFSRGGGVQNLGFGLASFAVGVALWLYFRTVRAKWLSQRRSADR